MLVSLFLYSFINWSSVFSFIVVRVNFDLYLFITGDVIYNAEFPLAAPDVIFGAEDEDFHPFHVLCGEDGDSRLVKNSLTDWNNKDPTRLLSLVIELRLRTWMF